MEQRVDDENLMIRYLLGELSDEERDRIEERFFADDEFFDRLTAVEDELVDEYVWGELSRPDRDRFEKRFLVSPQWRERVQFARALMKASPRAEVDAAAAGGEPLTWWRSLVALLRPEGHAFQLAMAAVAVLVMAAGAWLVRETVVLRAQLAQLQVQQQRQQQQMARQRARSDALAEQLQRAQSERARLEQELAERQPARRSILSFVLPSGLVRGSEEQKRLAIPPGAHLIKLQLDLEAGVGYKSYRAVLRTIAGDEIWSHDGLHARPTDWGRAVLLWLPARVFTTGEYELALRGVTPAGTFEDAGYYYFHVVRR